MPFLGTDKSVLFLLKYFPPDFRVVTVSLYISHIKIIDDCKFCILLFNKTTYFHTCDFTFQSVRMKFWKVSYSCCFFFLRTKGFKNRVCFLLEPASFFLLSDCYNLSFRKGLKNDFLGSFPDALDKAKLPFCAMPRHPVLLL